MNGQVTGREKGHLPRRPGSMAGPCRGAINTPDVSRRTLEGKSPPDHSDYIGRRCCLHGLPDSARGERSLPIPEVSVFLALLHALLDLAGRAVPDGDPLTTLSHLLRAVTGGVRLV